MGKQLSIKTKFGWISAFEEKDKIVKVKFGKHKNKSTSKNLKNFKIGLNAFLKGKSKSIKSNFFIEEYHCIKIFYFLVTKFFFHLFFQLFNLFS